MSRNIIHLGANPFRVSSRRSENETKIKMANLGHFVPHMSRD